MCLISVVSRLHFLFLSTLAAGRHLAKLGKLVLIQSAAGVWLTDVQGESRGQGGRRRSRAGDATWTGEQKAMQRMMMTLSLYLIESTLNRSAASAPPRGPATHVAAATLTDEMATVVASDGDETTVRPSAHGRRSTGPLPASPPCPRHRRRCRRRRRPVRRRRRRLVAIHSAPWRVARRASIVVD